MSSNNEKDTPKNHNYQTIDNYNSNNNNNSNLYQQLKNPIKRGRAYSSSCVDNSRKNNSILLNANKYISPAVSVTSIYTEFHHKLNHSRSESIHSNNYIDSKKYLNSKNDLEKRDEFRASPILHSSSSSQFQNNKSNSNKPIRTIASSDNNSINSYNYKPIQFKNVAKSQIENDVTSQLSNGCSISSINSANKESNEQNDNNNNNNNNNNKSNNNNNNNNNESKNDNDLINPKIKVNDKTLKNTQNYSNNSMKKTINSKMSISSTREKSSVPGVASSDIGSYYTSSHGLTSVRPKSNVSYQFDSSARTLTNGLNSGSVALNNHAPSINIYNPANYLTSHYTSEIRKKYSTTYSISSNSTILAPPRKYLNNNFSVYSYPKLSQMIYIVFVMFIVFCITLFGSNSTKWIIIDTRLKSNSTDYNNESIIHYEFGIYQYCYNEITGSDIGNNTNIVYECKDIESFCPKFCTSEVACVSFNPVGDGKDFEDNLVGEDSKDPEFSFCNLTSKSRLISKIFNFLNFVIIFIGISILYFLLKYREYREGSLKESLRKRISILSERYSFNAGEKRRNRLKNNNPNTILNLNNNNNNSNKYIKESEAISFGQSIQFAEPESYDDINSNINVNINPNSTNSNNNNNNNYDDDDNDNSNNSNNKNDDNKNNNNNDNYDDDDKKNQNNNNNNSDNNINNNNDNNQSIGRITYFVPTSPTPSNLNINETQSVHLSQQNIAVYTNSSNIDEFNKQDEELIIKRKKILRYLFSLLIGILFIIGALGIYFIIKWIKEQRHVGMEYKINKFNESSIELDKSLGVSLILISISAAMNIIIAIYLIVLLLIIHFSNSKIYWNNDGEDDLSSQSFDSLHPSNSYITNNYMNNNNNTSSYNLNTLKNYNTNHMN